MTTSRNLVADGRVDVDIDWWGDGVGHVRLSIDYNDNSPVRSAWLASAGARELAKHLTELADKLDAGTATERPCSPSTTSSSAS